MAPTPGPLELDSLGPFRSPPPAAGATRRKRTTTVSSDEIQMMSYKVEGLRPHEFPVVGIFVHPRILPGFNYRVRPLDGNTTLFSGRALQLVSVGQGYGKRITFKPNAGDKNGNDNYFWSDSRVEGFGFEIEVVSPGDQFTMYDVARNIIGNCEVIQNKDPQQEQSHLMWPDGAIEKWVVVRLICKIESMEGAVSTGIISGIAISSKPSRSASATIVRIMNCHLEKHKVYHGPLHQHPTLLTDTSKNKKLTLMPGVTSNTRRITVTGTSIQDVPATYIITGLNKHEFPVIGTYVDSRVLPGFHYLVRPAHAKNILFEGKPIRLLSIGRGYGKRFTFESSSRNENDNFFWSDSYAEGFGFAPHEVLPGLMFKILVGEDEIGTAMVKKANRPQYEIEMVMLPDGGVLKRLRIEIICHLEVGTGITRNCRVCGTAVVIRKGPNEVARVDRIEGPGLDSQLYTSLRTTPGEMTFIALNHQKFLDKYKVQPKQK